MVILAGPSFVGKSQLDKALARLHPQLRQDLQSLVLYKSGEPRPGAMDGVDYHFRSQQQIEELGKDESYIVMDVRGETQPLNLEHLH
jgi:guanylate kinase